MAPGGMKPASAVHCPITPQAEIRRARDERGERITHTNSCL